MLPFPPPPALLCFFLFVILYSGLGLANRHPHSVSFVSSDTDFNNGFVNALLPIINSISTLLLGRFFASIPFAFFNEPHLDYANFLNFRIFAVIFKNMAASEVIVIVPSEEELEVKGDVVCPFDGCNCVFKSTASRNMHITRHHEGKNLKPVANDNNVRTSIKIYYCPVKGCTRSQGSDNKPFKKLGQVKQV